MTILDTLHSEIVIKKSKFISYIYHVDSEEQAKQILNDVREEHKDARHVVYTYLINSSQKGASEDKEPIKSAHKLLQILENKGLDGILCLTVRYFGGIELGASNLERTYVKCITDLINEAQLKEEVTFKIYTGTLKTNLVDIFKKRLKEFGGFLEDISFLGPTTDVKFSAASLDNSYLNYLEKYEDTSTEVLRYKDI